jgi:hypothetical protein
MKASKELVQHISTRFWDKSNKEVAQCLADFKGKWFESEDEVLPTKINLDIEEPKQRDWTGVRYRHKSTGEIRKIDKGSYSEDYPYSILNNSVHYKQIEVDRLFSEGAWIELPSETEQHTIHAEKPNDLESRIEALNNRIINLEKRLNIL